MSDPEQEDAMPAPAPPQEEVVTLTARVRASTRRETKLFATRTGQKVQDVVEDALREYLSRHSS